MSEVLLYKLTQNASEHSLGVGGIQQSMDHVFVAEDSAALRAAVAGDPAWSLLAPGDVAPALPALITDGERLFIKGWLLRQGQDKERFGEGLPWDAFDKGP